jgi:hypothetical protein
MSLYHTDPGIIKRTIEKLVYQFQIKFPKVQKKTIYSFFRKMKEHGVLMAGGSILHILTYNQQTNGGDALVNDFDLYSPLESVPKIVEIIQRDFLGARLPDRYASMYSMSFLRKNGINKVISFSNEKQFPDPEVAHTWEIDFYRKPVLDVMQLKKGIRPLDVVSNFDLTFCQVWFDGEKFYATHPEETREKRGSMNPEYIPTYMKGNMFLKKRLNKYLGKGFTVCIPATTHTTQHILYTPIPKNAQFYERWFYQGALRYALNVYPAFLEDIWQRNDPQTGRRIWEIRSNMIDAWWGRAENPEAYRQAREEYKAAKIRVANISKPLDGIDDETIGSLQELLAVVKDGAKVFKGITDFYRKNKTDSEFREEHWMATYMATAERLFTDAERFRRTQLRSFTGSQFARSLPEPGLQRIIMSMANQPNMRVAAANIANAMPEALSNAAIEAALNVPPLRPQRGPLQAPNWGNRPPAALAALPAPQPSQLVPQQAPQGGRSRKRRVHKRKTRKQK